MTASGSNKTNIEKESAGTPGTADQLVEQGLKLHKKGDLPNAGRYYKQAIQMDPGNASAYHFLGILANQADKPELAVSMIEQAVSLSPELAPAYYNLGVALAKIGRKDEAIVNYEHALSLTQNDRVRFMDKGVYVQDRINICFGLAKAFADLKENTRAMACLLEANQLKRSTIEYNTADTKALFSSIQEVFTKKFMEENKLGAQPNQVPVFILGMPRSGTTMVEKIISSYPHVFPKGELSTLNNVFMRHVSHLSSVAQVREYNREKFEAAQTAYLKQTRNISEKALYMTDKMTQNFLFIGFIHMIFPRVRIIHCRRDPMETCFSIYKHLFTALNAHPYAYDQTELGQYYRLYANLMEHWKEVIPAGVIHEVEYEAMTSNHEQETGRLLKFLGLDWDNTCLEFHKNPGQVKTDSTRQVLKPINKGSGHLWKEFEQELGPLKNQIFDKLPSASLKKNKKRPLARPEGGHPPNDQIQSVIRLYQAGNMAQVEQSCKGMLKGFPNSFILFNLLGVAVQALGRIKEAVAAFDRMLWLNPEFAQGYYNRGVAYSEMGRIEEAVQDYAKAVELAPNFYNAHLNLGLALEALGHPNQAVQSFNRAIAIEPDNAYGYNNRAFSLMNAGNMDAALKDCEKAIAINPKLPEIYNIRGLAFDKLKKVQRAVDSFKQALQLRPGSVQFKINLAKSLNTLKAYDHALAYCNQVIESHPNAPKAYYNKGMALYGLMRFEEAIKSFDRAIELAPKFSEAFCNRGICFHRLGLTEKGFADFNHAIELDPNNVRAVSNRGLSYRLFGQFEEAEKDFDQALFMEPDHGSTLLNRAFLYLLTGDFEKGWAQYEWRWKKFPKRTFGDGKVWDGEPLSGKSIFIYGEQGFGDFIQFVRYLPLLRKMGATVILESRPALGRLMEHFEGYDRLRVQIDDNDTSLTDRFDYHLPIMSLPRLFKSTLETIPSTVPYLTVDNDLSRTWQGRMKKGKALRIGVVWAGNPSHKGDRRRSVSLSRFSPLKEIKGINLYSLQKEAHELWTDKAPETIFTRDFGKEISDFADTAAIINNLDLIISVDTSVAHLAGALGKETWVLLPFSPDWRWLTKREDSPWYPGMKLFRQPSSGDWDHVFKTVTAAVEQKNAEKNRCNTQQR